MKRTAADSDRQPRRWPARLLAAAAATACACALAAAPALAQGGDALALVPSPSGGVSATLEQCVTSVTQSERSATFTGEMTAIPGTARMAIRIDVEERPPEELEFRPVAAAGTGTWRSSDPKVKVFKYLRQVTNLSSPDSYRALVHFRWLNAKGHVIRRADRLTTRCLQPAASPTTPSASAPEGGAPSSTSAGATGTPVG